MSALEGELILITGAASGIGRATAELLASKGSILSLADMDEKELKDVAEQLIDDDAQVFWGKVDVRKREEVDSWVSLFLSSIRLPGFCGHRDKHGPCPS